MKWKKKREEQKKKKKETKAMHVKVLSNSGLWASDWIAYVLQ